ncbi:MAG TPA: hypothetical protein VG939_05890 [Caulobacteraceae bacterium]|nr:hypothetical protein [Caulobacteraceae bacterium]
MSERPPSDRPSSADDLKRLCDSVQVTRRLLTAMLTATAGTAAAEGAGRPDLTARPLRPAPGLLHPGASGQGDTWRIVRPEDLLVLEITLSNLQVQGGKSLVRTNPGQPGLLIATHQPQAIAEQAYQQTTGQPVNVGRDGQSPGGPAGAEPSPVPPNVAASRMAGPSRVVFAMPDGQSSFAWGDGTVLEGLLEACRAWPMVLEDTARPAPPEGVWKMGRQDRAIDLLQDRLDHAHVALRAALPAAEAAALVPAVDGACAEVAPAIAQAIARGRPLTEPEIDFMVGEALDRRLGPAAARQTSETLLYARRAVEAAASSGAVILAQSTQETPSTVIVPRRRVLPGTITPQTTNPQATNPQTTTPGTTAPSPSAPATTAQPPAGTVRRPPVFRLPTQPVQPAQPTQPVQPAQPGAQLPREPVRPHLPERTRPSGKLAPHEPSDTVTALEIPYRLFQSPLASAGWAHARRPVTHGGRTELWHTRLGSRRPWGIDDHATEPLRAIWSWDYPEDAPIEQPPPWWALNGDDRRMLVKLTAGFDEVTGPAHPAGMAMPVQAYTPQPSLAKRLMLTALGGWLDLDGHWEVRPQGVDIEAWSHKTAMARDYFVRVVYAGFLFPFGHAASLVKVTERKFETQNDGGRAAVLRQRYYIIVREPLRTFPGQNQAFAGRDFPFKSVEILTRVTPDIVPPGQDPNDRLSNGFYGNDANLYREVFFPVAASGDVMFQMAVTDGAGRRIPFQAPLLFVSELRNRPADIGDPAKPDTIAWLYATSQKGGHPRSQVELKGAVVQYAPPGGTDAKGDTNIPTDWTRFQGVAPAAAVDADQPQFLPRVDQAQVLLPAVKHLLGADKSPTVRFSKGYLASGFAAGPGEVFLDIDTAVSVPVDPSHPTDKFGGLMNPNLAPNALSRSFGVVTGAAGAGGNAQTFQSGTFDPADFLPGDAKLLGFIALKDVLRAINVVSSPEQTPTLVNLDLPDRLEVGFSLTQGQLKSPTDLFVPTDKSVLSIASKTIVWRDGKSPQSSVVASLTAFKINLFGFIILNFDALGFTAEPGKKAEVNVDFDPVNGVMFGGPLEFVNTLRELIPGNGFADPPGISVTPQGVSASYSLGLPTISVGALSLQNISFGAGFNVPFTGEAPSARFNFAERHSPFNLTVSLYGGGGFVAITVDTAGVKELEAALEFGAQIAIDLGVASGGVYVKGGFYFHWRDHPDQLVYFEGYLELGGHLTVLGLITASLVFHLALAYEKAGSETRLFGYATLTVEIDILFFSTSVDVTVEKSFAGSHDPRFIDLIPDAGVWSEYCGAFA